MSHNFDSIYSTVANHIQSKYGIDCTFEDLPHPITGDFNGSGIVLSDRLDAETRLFVLAHVFGHCVQFNVSEELYQFSLTDFGPHNINDENLRKVREYELQASQYGLQLFRDAGVEGLDQWLSDWFEADHRYLIDLYTTGKAPDPFTVREKYFREGEEIIRPLDIPEFTLRRLVSRYSF